MKDIIAPYPAVRLLLFVVAGILAGTASLLQLDAWLLLSLLFFLLLNGAFVFEAVRLRHRPFPHAVTAIAYLLFVFSSFAAGSHYRFNMVPERNLLHYTGRQVLLYGKIEGRPSRTEKGLSWTMTVHEVFEHGRTERLSDRAKIFMRTGTGEPVELRHGDMVRVKGTIRPIPGAANRGEFDPRRHARMQGIFVQLYCAGPWHLQQDGERSLDLFESYVVAPLYSYIVASVDRLIPDGGERKLVRGVLLGEREVLDREVFDAFKTTGTAHVLAVSGLNVGLLAFGIHLLLQRFKISAAGRWFSFILIAFILVTFSYVTGNSPSVKRAAIMSIVLFGGEALGRRAYGLNSLAVSDIIILLFDPFDLFNPGFLMTNAAVLAILLIYPLLYPPGHQEEGMLRAAVRFFLGSFFVSLAAIIGVSPVIAYYFGTFSLVSLAANLPVVFFSTVMMYALMPMLLFNLFAPFPASLFGMSGWFFARLTLDSALFFSRMPYASVPLKPDLPQVLIYYATAGAVAWFFYRKAWGRLAIAFLLGCNAFLWYGMADRTQPGKGVVTVNLGRNLALLYATGSETVIVDAGKNARDALRIMRQIEEYHLPPPAAALQFHSKDSLFMALPVRLHMPAEQDRMVLSSMVISRPMEKVLSIRSRDRSLLYVSGSSRLREELAWKADIAIIAVYRFREKQERQLTRWLNYAQPKRCIFLAGSFLPQQDKAALCRFAGQRPNIEIRRPDRQIVIR
ncbi:ComEC/Rec2 family competence protein [Chlorobium sp.]|uniref:ComEC/Rec2 family competence protein n=1 Tax=Chlorobium sp. TaxID=1095 RepID=UPI003C36E6DE